jgi:hypothetical protein
MIYQAGLKGISGRFFAQGRNWAQDVIEAVQEFRWGQ